MFYCIFDQIISAMVDIRDFFQKLKTKSDPKILNSTLSFLLKQEDVISKGYKIC